MINPMSKIKKFSQFGELILEKGGKAFDNLFKAAVVSKLNKEVKPEKKFTPPPPRPRPNISNEFTPKEPKAKPSTEPQPRADTHRTPPSSVPNKSTKFEFDPDLLSFGSRLGGEASRWSSVLFGKGGTDYELEQALRRASQPWFQAPTLSDLFSFFVDSMSGPSTTEPAVSKSTYDQPISRPKYEDPFLKKLSDEEKERRRREEQEAWEIKVGKRPAPPKTEAEKKAIKDWEKKRGGRSSGFSSAPIRAPKTAQDYKAIEDWKVKMGIKPGSPKTEEERRQSEYWSSKMAEIEQAEAQSKKREEEKTSTDIYREQPQLDYPSRELTVGCGINGVPLPGVAFSEFKSVFPNESFSLMAREISVGPDVSYQWQISINGNEWFNLRGKTNPECSQVQTEDRYYRMMSTCNTSGKSNVTNVVLIKMNSQKLIGMRRDLQVSFDQIDKTLQTKVEEFVIKFMVPIFEKYEIKIKERPESKIQLVSEMDDEIRRILEIQRSVDREVVDTILYLISR